MRLRKLLVLLLAVCLIAFPLMGCDEDGDCNLSINEDTGQSGGSGGSDDSGSGSPVVTNLSLNGPGSVDAGGSAQVTVTVRDQDGGAMADVNVSFSLTSNNSGASLSASSGVTSGSGRARVTYNAGSTSGTVDTVRASAGSRSDTLQISVAAEGPGSPQALLTGGADTIKGAGFFEATAYVGAFDPNASQSWADGWTVRHGETSADAESRLGVAQNLDTSAFGSSTVGGLPVTDKGGGVVEISAGTMTEDATLTSDRVWQLAGPVFVGDKDNLPSGDGITLTIEAGTKIEGLTDTGGIIPYLAVSRGHQIMAEGTREAPILMTSDTARGSGEWGGLIITGLAPINRTGGTGLGEGDTGVYGGSDPADSSGKLQYVVVAHAGHKFSDQNELNGIAFQAVGSETTIDHIQVHRNKDDGVEFFGGTAEARHIYLTENEDDSLDWTDGWQGKVQFVSIHKNASTGDQGIEADNLEENNDAAPRSHPVLANLTIRGYADNDYGILLRRGTAANFYNTIITGFGKAQIDIDNTATFTNGGSSATNLSGQLTMERSLVYGNGNPLFEDMEETGEPWNVSDWYNNQDNFSPQDPVLNSDGTLAN